MIDWKVEGGKRLYRLVLALPLAPASTALLWLQESLEMSASHPSVISSSRGDELG